jgi:hypothetical protein
VALTSHDSFRVMASQTVNYGSASAGQFTTSTTTFGSQTRWIQISATGSVTASNNGYRFRVGEAATVTADATATLVPLNWEQVVKVTPGQRIAVVGNGAGTGTLSVTEFSD